MSGNSSPAILLTITLSSIEEMSIKKRKISIPSLKTNYTANQVTGTLDATGNKNKNKNQEIIYFREKIHYVDIHFCG